jgi:hypothetical protein
MASQAADASSALNRNKRDDVGGIAESPGVVRLQYRTIQIYAVGIPSGGAFEFGRGRALVLLHNITMQTLNASLNRVSPT